MTDTTRDLLISLASHMAYMQGQLEARHELDDPEDYYWYRESVLLRQKVTDALTDEPAVPEGREPAAVITEPSDEEWDALVERAWDKYQTVGYQGERFMYDGDFGSALDLVRKELARWLRPVPAPPADGEVAELVAWLREQVHVCLQVPWTPGIKHFGRAASLLEQRYLTPVPVSERLPGPEVCVPHPRTKRGNWCWGFERCEVSLARPTRWRLMHMETVEMEASHWLPAHALPLPEVSE